MREATFKQDFVYYILAFFLFLRGTGTLWVLSKIADKDSLFEKIIIFLSNDMYAFVTSIILMILYFVLGKEKSPIRGLLSRLMGRKQSSP